MIIAIDGPAASGKGTLAKRIAAHFGLPHLDTGLLYRAVARDVRRRGGNSGGFPQLAAAAGAGASTRQPSMTRAARPGPRRGRLPVVAKFPEVRTALLGVQRTFAAQQQGAVLDGRDIGTVVCPRGHR